MMRKLAVSVPSCPPFDLLYSCATFTFCFQTNAFSQVAITLSRPNGVVFQAMFALLVYVCALAAHMRTLPYVNPLIDRQETMSIAAFIISVWLGVFMSLDHVTSAGRQVMTVLILFVNGGYVGYVAWLFFHGMKRHLNTEAENPSVEMLDVDNEAHQADANVQVNPINPNHEARQEEAEEQIAPITPHNDKEVPLNKNRWLSKWRI